MERKIQAALQYDAIANDISAEILQAFGMAGEAGRIETMTPRGLKDWKGASGKTYQFRIWRDINANLFRACHTPGGCPYGGVYMYVAVDEHGDYHPMQIGETDDVNNRPTDCLPQVPDEVHIYSEDKEEIRKEIVLDLKKESLA